MRWVDLLAHQARLVESPLDIREALREQMARRAKAWIFTSATLGDDDALSWFTEPAGLDDARVVRARQPVRLRRPRPRLRAARVPEAERAGHAERSPGSPRAAPRALGGRTFVLTTTLRALQAVGAQLRAAFDAAGEAIEVLVQGQGRSAS